LGIAKNPRKTWKNGELEDKRMVFNLVYSEPIVFDWNNGFGTAQMSPVFGLFSVFKASDSMGVEVGRIELPCNTAILYVSTKHSLSFRQKANSSENLKNKQNN
jgi:hypothetical protein